MEDNGRMEDYAGQQGIAWKDVTAAWHVAYTTELRNKYQYKRGRPTFTRGALSALYCKQHHLQQNTKMSKIHPNLHPTHISDNLLR